MKDNIQRFWKEYLVAVAIIVITGIFMNTDMVKFLQTLTGFAVSKSTATIVVNYSYIFLIILGPLLLIGTAGYSYYLNRLNGVNSTNHIHFKNNHLNNNDKNNNNFSNFNNNHLHHNNNTSSYHNAQDFHKVKFSSIDHEFHHFPHDNMMNLNSTSNNLNSALNNLNSTSNNLTSNGAQFMANNSNNSNNLNNLNNSGNSASHSMQLMQSMRKLDTSHYLCYPNAMDHLVLKQHIKNKLMQGHTMTEISEKLLEHNWSLEKINTAFNDLKLTNVESEIMLGSFVTKSLIAGYDVNTIRQTLVQKGWESKSVDKVVNLVFK